MGLLILAGAIGGFITNANRSSTGDITKSGDLTSNDLRVGDCWDLKDPTADKIDNVTAHPCGEAHKYEVFFVGPMPEGSYPSEDAFTSFAEDSCVPVFESYIGTAYNDSKLEISWLYPDSTGWLAGDRTIECSAFDPNDLKLTAAVKGSKQ